MDSWGNGAKGSDVKRVIDNNFDILDKKATKTDSRLSDMDSHLLKIDSRLSKLDPLDRNFTASDWFFDEDLKIYVISIPYTDYNKTIPCVEVYINNEDSFLLVYGGYKISKNGVDLQSDIPYEGRVVIR